jgi:putative glutathione S-transferase
MGLFVNDRITDGELPQETGERGQFRRVESQFSERVTADGSSEFTAEAGRYHLYVSYGCPWAHRTLIYRALKKLDGAISVLMHGPASSSRAGVSRTTRGFQTAPRRRERVPLLAEAAR